MNALNYMCACSKHICDLRDFDKSAKEGNTLVIEAIEPYEPLFQKARPGKRDARNVYDTKRIESIQKNKVCDQG